MTEKQLVLMFDLDGTLLDTNELIFQSFRYTFSEYMPDKVLTDNELISFLGPALSDSFGRFFPADKVPEIVDYYRNHNRANHEMFVKIFPTVRETLQYLKKENYPMAVVTTKINEVARIGLDLFELTPYFDLILGLDNVARSKPDPDGIYRSLDYFGCKQGIMIGDSVADIMAGKNAGVYTAGVEWTFKPVEILTSLEPDIMLSRMEELIPYAEQLEKQLNK